jgi:hypothetical protein
VEHSNTKAPEGASSLPEQSALESLRQLEQRPQAQRFKTALIVQEGASNQRLVSRKLAEAIAECQDEGKSPSDCPACALILHQLAWIMKYVDVYRDHDKWQADTDACNLIVNGAAA